MNEHQESIIRLIEQCRECNSQGEIEEKMTLRIAIVNALETRYEAQIAEAQATIKIYMESSVGIGEHPQHIDEVDKQLQKIAEAEEKLVSLQSFKL